MKHVYLMQHEDEIKVGISSNLEERLCTISGQFKGTAVVWSSDPMPSRQAYAIEQNCLKEYKSYRCGGEWFKGLSLDTLVSYLEAKCSITSNYDRLTKTPPVEVSRTKTVIEFPPVTSLESLCFM